MANKHHFEEELDRQLEEAFHNRPAVYGFWMDSGRELTDQETLIILNNVKGYDEAQKTAIKKCQVCGYPLHEENSRYVLAVGGDICLLCHELYYIVQDRLYFRELNAKWVIDNARKDEPPPFYPLY